jgi:hypothetical protein
MEKDMRKNDKSRTEHIAEMQRVIHEIEATTSEYRKRDLRKRLHRLRKQLSQYDYYRG